jgi:hypothetical protein
MTLNWTSSLQTLTRKMRKSLMQRGVLATAKRFVTKPIEFITACVGDLYPTSRRCRAQEIEFDRRHGVETCVRTDPGWMARIHSDNWIHGIGYAPVPLPSGTAILAGLGINYEDYVFVDYGAGKGRMLFLGSEFPFRRIIGVEYSPDLFGILQRNLSNYRNAAQRCFQLQSVLQDAVEFELPLEPLVLFFHHPFEEAVFRQVLAKIEQSLEAVPRDIRVIYYDSICGHVFESSSYFQILQQGERDKALRYSSRWTVYGSKVPVPAKLNSQPESFAIPTA